MSLLNSTEELCMGGKSCAPDGSPLPPIVNVSSSGGSRMGKLFTKISALVGVIYNKLGDPRTKNLLITILALMSAFGMIAPDTATALRNTVMSFAF